MTFDMNNDYSAACPGYKRRVKSMQAEKPRTKIERERIRPEYRQNKRPQKEETVPIQITARGMKRKIIKLTLQLD